MLLQCKRVSGVLPPIRPVGLDHLRGRAIQLPRRVALARLARLQNLLRVLRQKSQHDRHTG